MSKVNRVLLGQIVEALETTDLCALFYSGKIQVNQFLEKIMISNTFPPIKKSNCREIYRREESKALSIILEKKSFPAVLCRIS